jgi:hypothetical protein
VGGKPHFEAREACLPAVSAVAAISTATTPAATTAVSTAPAATAAVSTPPAGIPAAAAPATATGAFSLRPCFVHHEVSPAKILTVQGIDRAIRVFVVGHLDERKTPRLSRETIPDEINARWSNTYLREPLVELIFRR